MSCDTYTFKASLISLEHDAQYSTVVNKNLNVVDYANGKVELVLTAADTTSGSHEILPVDIYGLITSKGPKEDRYYLRPTYKLIITCVTENNGNFIAKVPEVYVD